MRNQFHCLSGGAPSLPDWPLLLRHYGNRPRYLDDELFYFFAERGIVGDGLLVTGYREDTWQLVLTISFRQESLELVQNVTRLLTEVLPHLVPVAAAGKAGAPLVRLPVYLPSNSGALNHYLVQESEGVFSVEQAEESEIRCLVSSSPLKDCLYAIYCLCKDK